MSELSTAVFVGRQKELNQLIDSLYNHRKCVTIVSSESGMGKSALLSRIYGQLKEKEMVSSSSFLVGFYDKNETLVGGSESLIRPFVIALKSLLEWVKDTTDYSDEFKNLRKRTQGALIKTLQEEDLIFSLHSSTILQKSLDLRKRLSSSKNSTRTLRTKKQQ